LKLWIPVFTGMTLWYYTIFVALHFNRTLVIFYHKLTKIQVLLIFNFYVEDIFLDIII